LGMVLRAHDYGSESVQAFQVAEQLDKKDPRWLYLQGLTLVLAKPDEGLACLERAAPLVPLGQTEPPLRLADLYVERGRLDDAEKLAKDVLDRSPNNAHALVLNARIAAERNEWEQVLQLTSAPRDHPNCRKQVARLRHQAYMGLGKKAEAQTEWQRAETLPPDPAWEDDYVREVERLRVGSSSRTGEIAALINAGRLPDAIAVLDELTSKYPKAIQLKKQLAELLIANGESARAIPICRDMIARDARSVDGWLFLGMAQLNTRDFAGASNSFRKVVEFKPDHGLAYLNLGIAYEKLGKRAEAIKAMTEAVRCRPDHEDAARLLRELQNEEKK
jgi:tetratricopeptide (TPR) repeat protein